MTDKPATHAPGIYDIPEDDYHELPYISNSDLNLVERSPAHYRAAKDIGRKEPTPAMLAGRILHCAILEPHEFDGKYVVLPEDAPRRPTPAQINAKNPSDATRYAVDWWNFWNDSNQGKETISANDMEKYRAIATSVRNHPEIVGFMAKGEAEKTFIAKDDETGLTLRCRQDWITEIEGNLVILDFKSCEDARPDVFSRKAWGYGYFRQAGYYKWVASLVTERKWEDILFLIAAFEKEPPYALKLYEPSDDAMMRAIDQYRKLLRVVKECQDTGAWPAYPTDIQRLNVPGWVRYDDED